jgi:hypothetical protein
MKLDGRPNLLTTLKSLKGLVAVALVSTFSMAPAQATFLEGKIERTGKADKSDAVTSTAPGVSLTAPVGPATKMPPLTYGSPRIPTLYSQQATPAQAVSSRPAATTTPSSTAPYTVAHARPSSGSVNPITPPNSFPIGFEGRWHCVTKVIDSAVDTIAVGTELLSEVNFVRLPGGRVVARWLQPGWTETQASAVKWNENEARVDRTSYYFGEGMNGSWGSRARDQFVQTGSLSMQCKSYVDQYLDGNYIGRYRTISVLTRDGTVDTIAQTEKPAYEPGK